MTIVFHKPNRFNDIDSQFHYCDACEHYNETAKRPTGGKFEPITAVDELGNTFVADGPQGCAFCGCPEHRGGGSLGDMNTIF